MSTAARRRVIKDIDTTNRKKDYIELYFLGEHVGNYDNDREVEEAKHEIIGY
jgi:hypothetical protein